MTRAMVALFAAVTVGIATVTTPAPARADPSAGAAIVIGSIAAGGLVVAAANAGYGTPYYPAPVYAPGYYTPPPYYAPEPIHLPASAVYIPPGCFRAQVFVMGAWRPVRLCY